MIPVNKPAWLEEIVKTPGQRLPVPPPPPITPRIVSAPRVTALGPQRSAPVRRASADYEQVRADKERQIARMVPIAQHLAAEAGGYGIICSDIRKEAAARGIITGEESDRVLSYLGRVPPAAGLVALHGKFRRSDVARSHGNLQQVHVAPEFAP